MHKTLLSFIFIFLIFGCSSPQSLALEDGDIVFQDSPSSQSQAIKLATNSEYSHMGIVYNKNGKSYVYEAVGSVVATPLDHWVLNGIGKHYVVKRLKDKQALSPAILKRMETVARDFSKKPYDSLFEWSDSKIYCSELVWKIYKRGADIELGTLKKLKSFDLTHPVVKEKLQERYGDNIPFEEKVIDPQGIFDSDLLKTVYER